MKKSIRKSLLACAVLASVLAGGFCVPGEVQAAQVNALVMPKGLSSILSGKEISFGQKRGYVQNCNLSYIDEKPNWQIIAHNGNIFLLAKESWGKNRVSDTNIYHRPSSKYHSASDESKEIKHYHYREVLNFFENYKGNFFTADELSLLSVQQGEEKRGQIQARSRYDQISEYAHVSDQFNSVFAMPYKELLNNLTSDQRKRAESYWLGDCTFRLDGDANSKEGQKLWYDQSLVDTNGNYQVANGVENKDFYPLLKIGMKTSFAYYGDRSLVGQSFQWQTADSTQPLHLAFRNTQTEKDVQIKSLEIAADKMKFTAEGLATGTGQGLGGILADNEGNYLSYVRLADTSGSGRAEDVTITNGSSKFLDNSNFFAGNYTMYLFNEKLDADSVFDYVGNFYKLPQLSLNSNGKITRASLSGNHNYTNLTIGENVDFDFTSLRYGVHDNGRKIKCEAVTVTNSLDWAKVLNAKGSITLSGSFSVANDTLTLVRPANKIALYWYSSIKSVKLDWNDMIYDGGEEKTATLHVNGDMHGLIVNGGTFIAEKDLKLSDYLRINNGATVKVNGKLDVALSGEITGTLQTNKDLDVGGFWHVYKGNKITAPNVNVKHTLMLEQDAVIDGKCNVLDKGTLRVDGNCSIKEVSFASGSILRVDCAKIQEKPAITCTGEIEVNDVKLYTDNTERGKKYKIIAKRPQLKLMSNGFGSSNSMPSTPDWVDMVWPEYGLIVDLDNSMFDDSGWTVTFDEDPKLAEYSDVPNITTGLINQADSIPWIEQLTNEFLAYPDKELYLEVLNNSVNTLANLNSLANVQTGLRTMSALVNDSIQENVGLRHEGKYDKQVWASVIHNKEKIEGRKTGHLEQNSTLQYNGIVVGADLWNGEHGFGGVALNYGSGNFHSYQMATEVKNEADYYGISIYNRQDVGKFRFLYDGGFTYGKNDVTLASFGVEDVTAKPKAWAYNVGLKVEEPVKLSRATELTPFAGLRYTFIKTKDFRDNYDDEYGADSQHLVNLPVGLTLKGTYQTKEGWELGGTLTGGYNWNLGNRNSTQRIGYAGFSDSMDFDTADRGEYFIRASLQAKNKNMIFELGYRYSKGNTSRDNRWNVNANFSF